MGPFPHDAPAGHHLAANPAGTDGFEFVEFAHPEPEKLAELFVRMGYAPVAKHKTRDITVWRQGDINYILNAEPQLVRRAFRRRRMGRARHRWPGASCTPSTPSSTRWGTAPSPTTGSDKTLEVPAIKGIGGSLLYFVDRYGAMGSAYDREFDWLGEPDPRPEGVGFYYLDHLTHNVYRGNMDKWFDFYASCSTSARSTSSTSRAS